MACASALALPAVAGAATIPVTTETDESTDNSTCSLREAVKAANNDSITHEDACVPDGAMGAETIDLPAGTYTLSGAAGENLNGSGDLDVLLGQANADLTFDGAGDGATIIDAANLDRAIDVPNNGTTVIDVVVRDLTIRNGSVPSASADGGAILMGDLDGTLAVSDATIRDSDAGHYGGAISFDGATAPPGETLMGPLAVTDTEFAGNTAGDEGGALYAQTPSAMSVVEVTASTFTGNSSGEAGGAIYLDASATSSHLRLLNSTVSGNTAAAGGGGIALGTPGPIFELISSTIAGNSTSLVEGGGGIQTDSDGQSVQPSGSIIAHNTAYGAAANCAELDTESSDGVFASTGLGSNVESADTCDLNPAFYPSLLNTDPLLAPLANNGGPTRTRGLYDTSPALDVVMRDPVDACALGEGVDQRGVPRPAPPALCDAGSVEGSVGPVPPPPPDPTPTFKCAGRNATTAGTTGRNVLRGTPGADVIAALGGNDTVRGLAGSDVICGGKGRDRLLGGKGRDRLLGQAGRDRLRGGPGRDKLRGGPGRDRQVQ